MPYLVIWRECKGEDGSRDISVQCNYPRAAVEGVYFETSSRNGRIVPLAEIAHYGLDRKSLLLGQNMLYHEQCLRDTHL